MRRSARYLTFDGQFENSVLGAFRIIRGFANLKDLAEVSVAYTMVDDDLGDAVQGRPRSRLGKLMVSGSGFILPGKPHKTL